MKECGSDPTDKKILELIDENDTLGQAWRAPQCLLKESLNALRSGVKNIFADKDALGDAKK